MPDSPIASAAIVDVAKERLRQILKEGWTPEHDDGHDDGELARAAACYAAPKWVTPSAWPWDASWWKPKNRRRDLVRAGALILAEIQRIDRAAAKSLAQGFAPHTEGGE